MSRTEIELRGRVMALETMVLSLMAHIAVHTTDEARFVAQIMANAENNLASRPNISSDRAQDRALEFAAESIGRNSEFLLKHLRREEPNLWTNREQL